MRLPIVLTFALVCSAFGQPNVYPIPTNGNMPRLGISVTGGPGAVGRRWIMLPNPDPIPPGSGPGFINPRSLYAAYGVSYDPIFDDEPSFDAFYADLPRHPYQEALEPPTPMVIINEDFRIGTIRPQLRDYSNMKLPEPGRVLYPPSTATAPPAEPSQQSAPALAEEQPIIWLIALQDHAILPAIAYWVQGSTLHYISLEGAPNQVSLALIDRDFSIQLNRERHVPFALPAAK